MKKPLYAGMTPLADDPSQPSYIRELLDAGRGARVSDYDVDRGLGAHMARVASGAPMPEWAHSMQQAPTAPAAAAAATAGKSVIGWVLAPAVAIVVVASGALLFQSTPESAEKTAKTAAPAAREPDRPVTVTVGTPEPIAAAEPAESAVPARTELRGVLPHTKLARNPAASATPAAPANKSALRTEPAPRVGSASSAPKIADSDPFASATPVAPHALAATDHASGPSSVVAEAPLAPQPEPTAAQPVAKQAPVKGQLDDARLEREMGMLSMTERVLRSDPDRALKLARQGEAEFVGSMFTQERQQLLLLALVKLGRIDEAKHLAKPYLARFPNGPFSDRVRRALATGKLDP